MNDIEIFNKKINEILFQFNNLKKTKDIHLEDKIKKIETILKQNNTIEEILLEFLNLKIKNNDRDLKEYIKKYEVGINKNSFIKIIGNNDFVGEKAYDKIINLFDKLKEIINEKNKEEQLIKIINILNLENKKYNQTFPIFFSINKELFFNSLIYMFIKSIKQNYDDEKKNIKNKDILIKKKDYYLNLKQNLENSGDIDKNNKLKNLDIIINNIELVLAINFYDYIINISKFINFIYDRFKLKFEKSDIFKCSEFNELKQKNDINLFQDFMYFLTKFNFNNIDQMNFYSFIWEETFYPIHLNEINDSGKNFTMKLIGNDLKITLKGKDSYIKNINYYISDVKDFIKNFINFYQRIPDLYELDKFLKFDKYNNVFIKSHWNELSDYLADILCSETIKEIYKQMYKMDLIISDKIQIKKILDSLKFFNYETDFIGETKKRFLIIYIQSQLKNDYNPNIDLTKLIYLTVFLICCIHEIIGHLYLRINNYLEDKQINSPQPLYPSDYAKTRKKESGEYIEEMLFGNYNFEMTIKEILFTLDKENYNKNNLTFRENFKKANNQEIFISNSLKEILNLYDININKIKLNSLEKFFVNKAKNEKIKFPKHHSVYKKVK